MRITASRSSQEEGGRRIQRKIEEEAVHGANAQKIICDNEQLYQTKMMQGKTEAEKERIKAEIRLIRKAYAEEMRWFREKPSERSKMGIQGVDPSKSSRRGSGKEI